VAFHGSFQQPALYHWFTGNEASTLCSYYDRRTQFDLWQFDTAWVDKSVFVCAPHHRLSKNHTVDGEMVRGFLAAHFQSANRLVTDFSIGNIDASGTPHLHHGDTLVVDYSIYNPYGQALSFQHPEFELCIKAQYLFTNDFCYCFYDDSIILPPHETYRGRLYTIVGDNVKYGKNRFVLGIGDGVSSFVTEENALDVIIEP
jgi:hypothetical protein